MIKSMTGYGKSFLQQDRVSIVVQIKTLNSKYFDFQLRAPQTLFSYEHEIKKMAEESLGRGKVNLSIVLDFQDADQVSKKYNSALFKEYYSFFEKLAGEVAAKDANLFSIALNAPDVMTSKSEDLPETVWALLEEAIKNAIEDCDQFRINEGAALCSQIQNSVTDIGKALEEIKLMEGERILKIRERIKGNLEKFLQDSVKIDDNRLEQEIIYFIEKLDIHEEMIRLSAHLTHFGEALDTEMPGKKLGFIAQEIGREVNTIGSKAGDATMQRLVVVMKEELEKIKEQTLNII